MAWSGLECTGSDFGTHKVEKKKTCFRHVCVFHDVFGPCNFMFAVVRLLVPIFLPLLAPRKLLGYVGSSQECFRVIHEGIWVAQGGTDNPICFDIFACLITFSVVQLFCGCRSRIRVPMQYACTRAGCVYPDGEGSTGPSRGKHWLTVYRAHASCSEVKRIHGS